MTNKIKNVPELRFPGFSGEWKEKRLGDIATTFSGGTPSSTDRTFYNGSISFIRSGEISKISTELKINEKAISKSSAKMVEVGDLLYALYGATSGEVAISKINGAINQAVLCIRSKESILYLFNYLTMKKGQILNTYIQGGQGNLSANIVKRIQIKLPCLFEQQKIGDFFSKLDRQIELEEQKLAKLEEQKKGYMQQIFSRQFLFENEKGDTDYSWRNFKIKDIFSKIESGNRLPKTNLVEGNIPYVIAQTTNNGVFMHISEDTLDYHKNKLKLFKKGSITISIDNPEAMFIQEMDFFTSNVMRVIHNENLKRGSHIFIMESLKKLTQSYNWSVKFSGPIIMDSTVKFPVYNDNKVNWNVVNKIGDFFNTFEIRINRQSDKIKLLEERKKGFLQKMFI